MNKHARFRAALALAAVAGLAAGPALARSMQTIPAAYIPHAERRRKAQWKSEIGARCGATSCVLCEPAPMPPESWAAWRQVMQGGRAE